MRVRFPLGPPGAERNNIMIIGVIGGAYCSEISRRTAYKLGKMIALGKHTLVCGGMGGVMESACKGAKSAGGLTIGILPGNNKKYSNKYIDIPIVTAMSHARNAIIIRTADVLVAVDGRYGTLSEIGLALACDKKVIGIKTWDIKGVIRASSVDHAMSLI